MWPFALNLSYKIWCCQSQRFGHIFAAEVQNQNNEIMSLYFLTVLHNYSYVVQHIYLCRDASFQLLNIQSLMWECDVGLRGPHRWIVLPGSEEQQSKTESSKTECTISISVYCMLNPFFTGQEEKLSSSLTVMIHAICDSASLFIALLVMAPSPCVSLHYYWTLTRMDRCWVNSPIIRTLYLFFFYLFLKQY